MDFSERKKPSTKDQVKSVACAKVRRNAHQRDEKSFTTANVCQNCRNRDTFSAKLEQEEALENKAKSEDAHKEQRGGSEGAPSEQKASGSRGGAQNRKDAESKIETPSVRKAKARHGSASRMSMQIEQLRMPNAVQAEHLRLDAVTYTLASKTRMRRHKRGDCAKRRPQITQTSGVRLPY